MMPQPFVLAVPFDWRSYAPIQQCEQISLVRADCPQIWCGAQTRTQKLGHSGLAVGVLFGRGTNDFLEARHASLSSAFDWATWLSREAWGGYVALSADPQSGSMTAFPDPSGLLPIYHRVDREHVFLASDPALFAEAGCAKPPIAWDELRSHLVGGPLRGTPTCLAGIDELIPGALVRLGKSAPAAVPVWTPDYFVGDSPITDFHEAADTLRSCAVATLGAWARLIGPIGVASSGGLDSSLICAALAEGGHPFGCITISTSDPSGDERVFVDLLARHLGVSALACEYDPEAVDINRPASACLPRPTRRTFMQALDAALGDASFDLGANVVFDGNGGDSLFCFLHSAAPILDRVKTEGLRAGFETMVDMCGVTGCDLLTMAEATLRRNWRGGVRPERPPDLRLLCCKKPGDRTSKTTMPWVDSGAGALGGKRDHLRLILQALPHANTLGMALPPRFSPLLSQPMVELCLSLPTWLWCHGGINRALARAAFAKTLPQTILKRRAKSGPDSFIRRLFAANQARIRELLLGGLLAENGIIDCGAVEIALATDVLSGDAIVYRLLELVEAETWARSWTG